MRQVEEQFPYSDSSLVEQDWRGARLEQCTPIPVEFSREKPVIQDS
jgi:hypothetical protein